MIAGFNERFKDFLIENKLNINTNNFKDAYANLWTKYSPMIIYTPIYEATKGIISTVKDLISLVFTKLLNKHGQLTQIPNDIFIVKHFCLDNKMKEYLITKVFNDYFFDDPFDTMERLNLQVPKKPAELTDEDLDGLTDLIYSTLLDRTWDISYSTEDPDYPYILTISGWKGGSIDYFSKDAIEKLLLESDFWNKDLELLIGV